MMVAKARLFSDEAIARAMLASKDPKRHKALGRKVKGFREEVWNERMYTHEFTLMKRRGEVEGDVGVGINTNKCNRQTRNRDTSELLQIHD